jgi:NADP-dependent 3-hydroxy acid dehydrogenase YdfG
MAAAALKRGDKVAATARKLASIADLKDKYGANLLTLELDVTKPEQVAIFSMVDAENPPLRLKPNHRQL